jgi:hypothetical protein
VDVANVQGLGAEQSAGYVDADRVDEATRISGRF